MALAREAKRAGARVKPKPSARPAVASSSEAQPATERQLVVELEGMLEDAESHSAALLHELQVAHQAVTAREAERSTTTSNLSERLDAARRSHADAAKLRTFVNSGKCNLTIASQSADEMGKLALASIKEAVSVRASYESLHAHARERVAGLAKALTKSRKEEPIMRTRLIETGVLLCQTHAAVRRPYSAGFAHLFQTPTCYMCPPAVLRPNRSPLPPIPRAAWHAAGSLTKTSAGSNDATPDRFHTG